MEEISSCSSTVTGVSGVSFLQNMLERLSTTQCLKLKAEESSPVAVIALQRYLSEQTDGQQPQTDTYSYDVTVTDGVWRAKCFLDPKLNHLVNKNLLRTGADVRITQCSFVYNERRLGHGYICIENLTCGVSSVWLRGHDVTALPILVKHGMERSVALQSDVPLQVSRKHYLALWNNDDPDGDMWAIGSPSSDTVLDVTKITLLCNLESNFRSTWKPLPLLVKIMNKSRLRYYGKFGQKIDYPYQAYFEVADQSGMMSLVLWNELCPEFYQRLNVGMVLYLQNYTLKQSYSKRSRPQMGHHRMKSFNSVEICLNPRKPASVITVISPKSVLPQWELPEVAYQFTTRSELEKLPKSSVCDVIGLVTFVGRVERVKSKGNIVPEKYWTYRWVHAVDGSSDLPFILEVFSSSQSEIFNHICPMTYLVCTQMRVCRVEGSVLYLTTSCETEMFITGHHKGQPYVTDPRVKSFIQWTKTLKDNVVLQKTAVGGHYCYPHAPKIFTQSMDDATAQIPLVAFADLKREIETLHYREHKRLAIQGQIMAVQYMKSLKTMDSYQTEEGETSGFPADTCEDAEQDTSCDHRTVEQTTAASLSPSSEKVSPHKGKRSGQNREGHRSSVIYSSTPAKRRVGHEGTEIRQEQEEIESGSKEMHHVENQDSDVLFWQSSSWPKQQQDVSEHLRHGRLCEDSISQRFTFDEKNVLLQSSNLHPSRWTSRQTTDTVPSVVCPGYYQITILGINKQLAVDAAYLPVVHSEEPRAVGLPQDPHGNSALSCLSSGFLCPLSDTADLSQSILPQPEEILATAGELEDLHVVCVLDLCHLGGNKVEILINKVYGVTEVTQ